MPIDRTQEASFTDHHLKDLATFGRTLTTAANAAFPKVQPGYKEVHVLLLSWEEDDLGVITEVLELQEVFSQTYHYDVHEWRIPSDSAQTALRKRLVNNFLDNFEGKDNLLIVYYGGHGLMNDNRECVWASTRDSNHASIQWSGFQSFLESSESDVLILLDCCAAASSISGTGRGVTELIAACGFETWTPGVGKHSFTRSLIDELKYCGRDDCGNIVSESSAPRVLLSTGLLHNMLLSRIKHWSPKYSDSPGEQRKTPVYVVLANEGPRRSVELAPHRHQAHPAVELAVNLSNQNRPSMSSDSSSEQHYNSEEGEAPSSQSSFDESSLSEVWNDEVSKVLLSVALEGNQVLHTDEWVSWLASAPVFVKSCHVEGLYKSGSTLMLITLPIALWNLLPANPAINFIGFVDSWNLIEVQRNPSLSTGAGGSPEKHPQSLAKSTHRKFMYKPMMTSNPGDGSSAGSAETNAPSIFDEPDRSPASDSSVGSSLKSSGFYSF